MGQVSTTQDVVVGSGAGGAVLAARLAEAGRAVVLVEEGPRVSKADFTQREDAMYGLLYRDAGNQLTKDGSISVLQGRCLGGSTTVNMGDCVPSPESVLEHWRQHFGWGDWGGISNADIARASARAMADMGAGPIPDALFNRNNRLLQDGAAELGLEGSRLLHNRTGCVGSGYCLIGCAYDAKRGTLLSHVPRAIAAGAEVLTGCRVDRVTMDGSRATGVVGDTFDIRAERVFLCAGPIHSCGILARSGLKRRELGRFLSLQPQAPITALFTEPVDFHRGVPQAWGLDGSLALSVEAGLGGFSIESVSAGPGMTASLLPVPMAELKPLLARYRHIAAALCLVPDRPTGRVVWGKGTRPAIRYASTPEHRDRLVQALQTAARIYLAAGAEGVLVPSPEALTVRSEADVARIADLPLRSCELPLISAHPQGTCRMAGPGEPGVLDLDFGVRGADALYVCDASIFPTTASTHTMVPVMAMAHLLADQLGASA